MPNSEIRNKSEARSPKALGWAHQLFGFRISGFLRASVFGIRISAAAFPVRLVIWHSEGEVRWMEVRDWSKRVSENGGKPVKQIVFAGERFDVMSVRRWQEKALAGG